MCETHDPTGEPDAVNPPVRFGERRLETEPWRGVRHRHCESRRQQLPPSAYRYRASRRLYPFPATDPNELIPPFWESHYSSLRSLLESSVPTGRNRLGGHGQGTIPTTVPDHIVAYMLHMTASAIVFLAEAERSL